MSFFEKTKEAFSEHGASGMARGFNGGFPGFNSSSSSSKLLLQKMPHDHTGIVKQLRAIGLACEELPLGIEMAVTRILESIEVLVYVLLAVGLLLILAEVNLGLGIIVKESAHIGYESAKLVDTVVNGFLHFIHKITSFFHIHWHPPYIHLEDHLVEFKSSNPRKICSELASYTAMFLVFPRMSWSPHICPILRYFYGTPIDTIISPFISWASYDWAPEGNNCRKPHNLGICIFCEFFYLLRLIAYALLFVLIVGPAWPFFSDLLDIAIHVAFLLFDIAFAAMSAFCRGVHVAFKVKHGVDRVLD